MGFCLFTSDPEHPPELMKNRRGSDEKCCNPSPEVSLVFSFPLNTNPGNLRVLLTSHQHNSQKENAVTPNTGGVSLTPYMEIKVVLFKCGLNTIYGCVPKNYIQFINVNMDESLHTCVNVNVAQFNPECMHTC